MGYSSEEKMKILYEESLTDIRGLMSEIKLVKADLSEISENINSTITNFANKNLQLTSVEIFRSASKAVANEFSGYKLALSYGSTDLEAFNLAISKIEGKLSERTLQGCRLIVLGGMGLEEAAHQVAVMPSQLNKVVKQIKNLIPTELSKSEKQVYIPLSTNTKGKHKPDSIFKYAQFFGCFVLGLTLMYFLK